MESTDIKNLFNQLAGCVQDRELDRARTLSRTIYNRLLKSIYAQVRGQAPPASMRSLLELEIDIGGENGDFRNFDSGPMTDLFIRVRQAGLMADRMALGQALSSAVDLAVVARWLESRADESGPPSLASVLFVQAWLRLLAQETGFLDTESRGGNARLVSQGPQKNPVKALDEGTPYIDPICRMNFVFIPGGSFSMGDTFDEGMEDEKPVHTVTLSPFYMAACPVTQAQWKILMADNPSNFDGDDHPVEQVTLAAVQAFIDKLNAASPEGLHFDLPSEAQWEYAARSGGKDEMVAGGDDPDAVAWFADNNTGGTAPVGSKAPNRLGLYDMSGNVWEWCRDIYHPTAYRRHGKIDPVCTSGGTDRVIRGGSWHLDAWSARCSRRFRFDPELYGPGLGFRVVMRKGDRGIEGLRD
jgi:hypothetical protein